MVRRINPDHSRVMHEQVAQLEQQFFVPPPEGIEAIAPTDPTSVLGQLPDDETRIWVLASLAKRGAVDMTEVNAPGISDQFDEVEASTIATDVARYTQSSRIERLAMRLVVPSVRRAIRHGAITK